MLWGRRWRVVTQDQHLKDTQMNVNPCWTVRGRSFGSAICSSWGKWGKQSSTESTYFFHCENQMMSWIWNDQKNYNILFSWSFLIVVLYVYLEPDSWLGKPCYIMVAKVMFHFSVWRWTTFLTVILKFFIFKKELIIVPTS